MLHRGYNYRYNLKQLLILDQLELIRVISFRKKLAQVSILYMKALHDR